ncbi:hypothetical protein CspeluHIS016_0104420 [Cutaneotrichosporon spelunceum]|uniref:SLC41A/MgtE integral membrane domain-containing protein n=1 Tax=Cutaneotrichosporon spelunceum TaxID=1672016 RepID=A0AAD3Y825_9TREE|nr:hypothetical protein CspeluHIS016_0104420 [Cutaneotrichosporon spelunceum]
MSPILKRDVAETVRQARRLAAAAGLSNYNEHEYELNCAGTSRPPNTGGDEGWEWDERNSTDKSERRASASSISHGITSPVVPLTATKPDIPARSDSDANREAWNSQDRHDRHERLAAAHPFARPSASFENERDSIEMAEIAEEGRLLGGDDLEKGGLGKWADLRGLLFSSTPSLLFALVGLVFCGQLLEHCARWRVFRRVDELFILVPMIGNLKGNLEMCLSARLGTSATLGELDTRRVRRSLVTANLTLLGLQALLISSLAAVLSFLLGLMTTHRLGDVPSDGTAPGTVADPSIDDPWREGYTRPGPAQLVMVLATGMAAAGLSALVLGSFMCALVVLCRWVNVDPDNITPPIAACLGDLLTLFLLALAGTVLVGAMDTPVPLVSVIIMGIAALWFTHRVMRDTWVKDIARGSWLPLIGAMLISSGTGMVLESGVGKYRGFALLAISMTGLTGAIGAIHANRLSTQLHRRLHPGSGSMDHTPHSVAGRLQAAYDGLTPTQSIVVLFALSFPCQAAFVVFVNATGWIDVHLGWVGWVAYALATAFSLLCAQFFTLFCWHRNLDPDSYTLPIHSAIVDFVGQLLLVVAYEIARRLGRDVMATSTR